MLRFIFTKHFFFRVFSRTALWEKRVLPAYQFFGWAHTDSKEQIADKNEETGTTYYVSQYGLFTTIILQTPPSFLVRNFFHLSLKKKFFSFFYCLFFLIVITTTIKKNVSNSKVHIRILFP